MKLAPALEIWRQPLGRQAQLFVLAGVGTVCLDYLMLYALVSYLSLNYLIATAFSFLVASGVNYLLSVRWIFVAGKYRKSLELSLFMITSLLGLAVNQLAMWALVDRIQLDYRVAKLVSIALVTIWNYSSKKRLVFID